MEKREFELFTEKEERFLKFFIIPEEIFQEKFQELDSRSIVLYGHLIRRMRLSRKNGWIDGEGYVFAYFTIKEACRILHVCRDTAIKSYRALEKHGLLTKKRQGLGRPDKLYVHNITQEIVKDKLQDHVKEELQDQSQEENCEKELQVNKPTIPRKHAPNIVAFATSFLFLKIRNSRLQEVDNIDPITKEKSTEKKNLILTKEFMEKITENNPEANSRSISCASKFGDLFDEQALHSQYTDSEIQIAKKMVNDIFTGKKTEYRISGKVYSAEQVKDYLCQLSQEDMCEALNCLKSNRANICNEKRYLLTVLLHKINADKQTQVDTSIFPKDSFEMQMVMCLVDKCRQELPESTDLPKTEKQYQVWATPIHQLLLGGYSKKQIQIAMDFAISSEFWRPHVRTTNEFKNKFDKLYLLGAKNEQSIISPNTIKKNKFNNFEGREYDLENLERALLEANQPKT